MKLVFDCRFIRLDHHDGISRFSSELFSAVSKRLEVTALISDLAQLRWLPEGVSYIIANDPTDPVAELSLPRKLNQAGATHVFSPMQTMGSFGKKYKLMLTLHDLIYYSHPKAPPSLPLYVRIAWRIYHLNFWGARALLNRADAVVTVSETSKKLILSNRLTVKPVHVIYNAPDSGFDTQQDKEPKQLAGRNQLVYMGSFMPYKNVESLVRAMEFLPDHELVLLSKISPKRQAELTKLAGPSATRLVFKNGVTDSEYGSILAGAFALVSASQDEGFGIPLVEAMSQGIPLIVSDIPIFREVAAGAAGFFDPRNPNELALSVQRLSDSYNWKAASTASFERSQAFNWDDSAEVFIEAIRQL
jgi:glycosyltransferase involved in cell wall biosynthesis